jgi:programmed cell death protein 4
MEVDSVFNNKATSNKAVHFSDQIDIPVDVALTQSPTESKVPYKPKRRTRNSSSSSSKDEDDEATARPIAPSKLRKLAEKDRHVSRTGKGRGKPKKGGAGGKGTWGKMTEVYNDDGTANDAGDPNYDSNNEEDAYIESPPTPHLKLDEFQKEAETLFKEYFNNSDKEEVLHTLNELNIKNIKPEIICSIVTLALDKKHCDCELASQLISFLCGSIINSREISSGFDILLKQLSDLSLDAPNASEMLGNFIARAVADDCLPPAYVQNHYDTTDPTALKALKRAKVLLGMRHSHANLEHIWGNGGGQKPLVHLIDKIVLLLKEYLSCGDKNEVIRCLQELSVPHFHHQVVYQATVFVLEDGRDACIQSMTVLLHHLATTALITPDQFKHGFQRVFDDMTEIVLDVPYAYTTLAKFMDNGLAVGFVTPDIYDEMPQRGRKRFISEGDGGAIKHAEY